ncbi:biosynthetic peptidoglycan transglycosylase [Romboutsia sp.]|uniref:biosynthetic peptidoglycan transglycosylase n=1 Tax=Romboutsia sp. TaxID=1965302 RepID=UPI002C4745F1|nr:biosynthetic peptidoglycan transglycosylase [Romboutsia sp.]HSQ87438.1 biosynthetic peptidoglycan transglycosylase [Romboutsia sp.]
MSYNNDNQNKIRRRKVNSSNLDSQSLKSISNNEKKEINNIKQNKNQSNCRNNRKRAKTKKKLLNRVKQILVVMLIVLVVISVVGSVFIFAALTNSSKVTKELLEENYISSDVVSKDEIPKYLKDAIVSIEDERFYKHNGVDEISLARSLVNNIFKDTTQGGSTIEMQISKNLLTNDDKTIKRKIKDIYNATSMDKNMSKEDILEVYLNNIYLGKSSYGIEKGARVYFGENVSDLNLAQCAMLAGITNNPARYSEHREAKIRQETILYKMHELGYINDKEYQDALAEEVPFKSEIE